MTHDPAHPVDTLRLSPQDQQALIDHLNQSRQPWAANKDRRGLRVAFSGSSVTVSVTHPNGAVTTYSVVPRNLSTRGFGFVHGRFLYIDSPCEVELPTLSSGKHIVTGRVVQCRKLTGITHEISLVFDEPIDLSEFVDLDEAQHEQAARELAMAHGATSSDPAMQAYSFSDMKQSSQIDMQPRMAAALDALTDLTRRLEQAGSRDLVDSLRGVSVTVTQTAGGDQVADLTRVVGAALTLAQHDPVDIDAIRRSVDELTAIAQSSTHPSDE